MKQVKWIVLCVLFLLASSQTRAGSKNVPHWIDLPAHSLPTVIVPDGDDGVWVGDEMRPAITHIDALGHLRFYQVKGAVSSLARDKENRVWFSMYEGGLGYIEKGRVVQLTYTGSAYSLSFNRGFIWFLSGLHGYGCVDSTGHIQLFKLSGSFNATHLTGGPDGNLWLTDPVNDAIGKVDSNGPLIAYPLPPGSHPVWITSGPDKMLWFLNETGVGNITFSGRVKVYTFTASDASSSYGNIIPSQNGHLIFSMDGNILQITSDGKRILLASLLGGGRVFDNGYIAETSHLLWFTDLFAGKVGYLSR